MATVDYTILITDPDTLDTLGDPITMWEQIDVTLRFNEPGSGLFVVAGYDWIVEQLVDGCRVVVIRHLHTETGVTGSVLISGPMEKFIHERSDDGENAGDGKVTVYFADDLAKVVARQTYPDPTLDPDSQVTDQWTYTGNAELALRELVNKNAGPGALTDRQIPGLVLGSVASVGSSITVTAERMEPLGAVARRIADAGGALGFRTSQVGSTIEFQVYEPPDLSGDVRFGFAYGNLKYVSYERTAPTVTAVIVGGQGETGGDRFVTERVNTAEQTTWGRYEKLVSRPGNDPLADLEDEADRVLGENAATTRVATNVADTPNQRFGVDYGLGSKVAVEHQPGGQFIDVVKTVHLQVYATAGEIVAATVGSQAARSDPYWVQRLRELEERLGTLERSVVPST